MKKTLAVLSLVALLFVAGGTALASEGKDGNARGGDSDGKIKLFGNVGLKLGGDRVDAEAKADLRMDLRKHWPENGFAYAGTVKSVSGDSFVLTVKRSVKNEDNGKDITIKTNADTKIMILDPGKKSAAMSDIKAGAIVWAAGKIDGSANLASWVHIKSEQSGEKKKIMGEVTAKTDTSITIKNNISGQTTTVPVNDGTKISVNGEAKTMADVQVGDKGVVKFKTVLNVMIARFIHLFR
jgi:hypothetical protein